MENLDKNINKEMPAWLNTFVNSIVKLKKTAADDEDFDDEELPSEKPKSDEQQGEEDLPAEKPDEKKKKKS